MACERPPRLRRFGRFATFSYCAATPPHEEGNLTESICGSRLSDKVFRRATKGTKKTCLVPLCASCAFCGLPLWWRLAALCFLCSLPLQHALSADDGLI